MTEEKRKAKTLKGRKFLKRKEPQLIEGPRNTLFLRGTKTSETVSKLMHELYIFKKSQSLALSKRYDFKPFESASLLENLCTKNIAPLFMFGSNSKKKPDNLIVGRVFNSEILDMVEFGIQEFKSREELTKSVEIPINSRPCLIFQGDLFEYDAIYIRMKNLFQDFFVEGITLREIDISKGLNFAIVFSANEERLSINTYEINLNKAKLEEPSTPEFINLKEIGPSCELKLRRHKFAPDDAFKLACKHPKLDKKKVKNITTNNIGDKKGKVWVDNNDISTLSIKRIKKKRKLNVEAKNHNKTLTASE